MICASFKKENGFTLVEVLIAIVILSLGMLSLASLMPTTIKSANYGKNTTMAANLAQQKIEDLDRVASSNFDNVVDSVAGSDPVNGVNPDQVEDYGSIAGYTLFRRETYVTNGAGPTVNIKDVAVRVLWREGLTTHQTLLRTSFAR